MLTARMKQRVQRGIFHLVMAFGALVVIFPIIYMFSASLMTRKDIFATPIHIIPPEVRLLNYVDIFTEFNIQMYFFNSVFVTGTVILLNVLFCTMVGYSLSKFHYPGRQVIFYFILATTMVPLTVIVIPLYILVRGLGWTDTYLGLIIPPAMTPFGVFLMRQFTLGIPTDYLEAARIDGCSEPGIFFRIVFPNLKAAYSALAIITFVTNWNSFLWPLIAISTEKYKTLPLGLAKFLSQYQNEWNLLMSASVVAVLPLVVAFLILQKRFIEGMSGLSGLKS